MPKPRHISDLIQTLPSLVLPLTLGCILLLMSGCLSDSVFEPRVFEGRYSIHIPDYLNEVTDLNEEAAVQYQNLIREVFLVVISSEKKALLAQGDSFTAESLYQFASSNVTLNNLSDATRTGGEYTEINGLTAYLGEIRGNYDGVKVFYKLAVIEGETHFYQVLCWTLASKRETYGGDIDRIIASFREL